MKIIFSRWRKHRYLILLSLLLTALVIAYSPPQHRPAWLDRFELLTYDLRLRLTLPNRQDRRIVIVDVDEVSLQQEGRWPWPRDRLASLLDQLFDRYQVRVVGFDMVFAEADESHGIVQLRELAERSSEVEPAFLRQLKVLEGQIDRDAQFARAMRDRRVVLGYYFQSANSLSRGGRVGLLPESLLPAGVGLDDLPLHEGAGYGANLALLQQATPFAGYFDIPLSDDDGVIRRVPLLRRYQSELYDSLSLAVLRAATDDWFVTPVLELDEDGRTLGLDALSVAGLRIPVDDQSNALVPYLGRQGSFPYVSAADVLSGTASRETLQGAIVLVGTTSPGLLDLRATPVQSLYAGVEIHANLLSGMLDGAIRHIPGYILGGELVVLALLGVLLALLYPCVSARVSIVVTIALLLLCVKTNLLLWNQGLVMPLASTLVVIVSLFMLHMAYGFLTETRMKLMISRSFGQYIPPELVDELLDQPDSLDMQGDSREMTVLFSDVRGFTHLSEGLPPQQLTELMNAMLTPMTQVIHQRRGTIDKYMGDAIMAFWGAPLRDPQHAEHAMQAAMDMLAVLPKLQHEFERHGWPPIKLGIGLNSGEMSVGNMGSQFRMAYTVLGDAVNLGSRLEGLTKAYGVPLIVSESTRTAAPNWVYRELDKVRVKGKDLPVTIFQPLCRPQELDEALALQLQSYEKALAFYRAADWQQAAVMFAKLKQQHADVLLYDVYLQRVEYYRQNPPLPDWDGVFVFETK